MSATASALDTIRVRRYRTTLECIAIDTKRTKKESTERTSENSQREENSKKAQREFTESAQRAHRERTTVYWH